MDQNTARKYMYKEGSQPAPEVSPILKQARWVSLDMARGIAITLMIFSHCVKGLLSSKMIPAWGLVPVHLITKFSSSLFIIVFGMSISLYFVPHIQKKIWNKKRFWMIKRGLQLLIIYKVLTVVQMFQFYPKPMIIDTLLFKRMPDFVEILCFYSIILMWLPFALPIWSKMNPASKVLAVVGTMGVGQWLHYNFDFWQLDTLKAILVEHKDYYTFGQFQRGSLVLFGLFLGDIYQYFKEKQFLSMLMPLMCVGMGSLCLSYFLFSNSAELMQSFTQVASNIGKHPPELQFMSFSIGGALVILGLCLMVDFNAKKMIQPIVRPITYLGQNSLNAFALHIVIIFYFYRYYFALHRKVSYFQSISLTVACIGLIILSLYAWNKLKAAYSMKKMFFLVVSLGLVSASCTQPVEARKSPKWVISVGTKIKKLEKKFDGEFGIYIKDLDSQTSFGRRASQFWYLSSTVKIPVAIALLKNVDEGKVKLTEKVTIKKTDYRDGAGPVNWIKPGKKVTYQYLLDKMLKYSDNAATDLIIKRVGIKNVNNYVSESTGKKEFGEITTLLDVRKKAYSEFHSGAENLSNFAFFAIKKRKKPWRKISELAKQLKVPRKKLKFRSLNSGFDKYYAKKWNSAPLTSYAMLLENLIDGKILSPESTKVLINTLSKIHTGKRRISSGLPKKTFFAHKTGTQHRQACDLGFAGDKNNKPKVLILVCAKNWKKLSKAEKLMSQVGGIVSREGLL